MSGHRDFEALARQMKGRSPARNSLLLLLILGFIAAAVLWAALTEIDDVTRADGRVVPSGDVQIIEAAENGVLEALHVSEGEVVAADALLMELDGMQLTAQLDQEQQRAYGLMARIERLETEIAGTEEGLTFEESLVALAPEVVKTEAALYQGRLDSLSTEIAILENQREQRQREHEEELVGLATAEETLAVMAEERAMMEPLVTRGIEPQTTLLTLRRSEVEWEGRKVRAEAAIGRFASVMAEIDAKIAAQKRSYRADALTDLAISTAELAALKPSLPALQQRAGRAQIRAPLRGVVNRIHRTTRGSMARAGEPLLEIVPLDDTLLVEAYIQPDDIAFLYPGQKVKVKITAYDFARYGALDGEILRIGADTIQRSERNDEEVFVAEIRTQSTILDAAGETVQIMPGMIAQVDILAGRKTVLDYIIKPVIKVKDQAFRE
ncbi:HlyD family type I secretion periplasmic adaptor subunit [Salipiger marinus]|uniref:Membrane fusion protein (MFP) family protein n=1 Tax=Salipiger marinus TaxID=555512 RepID=A0A1G8QK25_9RHOB|nr:MULTISPECIES: HlyD family type I secretion periplasmic adaptor subunit [Salipiger]MEB3421115.1 HlyD family type I secretion periplasmic adaptor subunit [Salipiger manganoxidans]SDJ05008.1 membrane fusion protein, adhesin transport system [Salipiger marinus]